MSPLDSTLSRVPDTGALKRQGDWQIGFKVLGLHLAVLSCYVSTAVRLKWGLRDCPETSVNKRQHTLRDNPKEGTRRYQTFRNILLAISDSTYETMPYLLLERTLREADEFDGNANRLLAVTDIIIPFLNRELAKL